MWKISIHLSAAIYSKNQLNLQDTSSTFLMMIYQSLCSPEKPFFLMVNQRVVMRISTFQWVVIFLKLLKKHFPTSHILHKIFNKNTVKISYSCMKNINSVISSHIKNILNPRTTPFGCNCRKKESCPLNGECLTSQLVYRATVTNAVNEDMNKYIGLADTTFKERHSNHKRDFKHQKYCNCTELAKYVWELKEKDIAPILSKVYGNPKQNMCIICLTEKLWIINFIHDNNYLNIKSELINKCRHFNKVLLRNVK